MLKCCGVCDKQIHHRSCSQAERKVLHLMCLEKYMCNFWQWNLLGNWAQVQIQPMEKDLNQPLEMYLWGVTGWHEPSSWPQTLWHHWALSANLSDLPSHPGHAPCPQFWASFEAIKPVTFPGHEPGARPSPATTPLLRCHKLRWQRLDQRAQSQVAPTNSSSPELPMPFARSPWLRHRLLCDVIDHGNDVMARPDSGGSASCAGTEGPGAVVTPAGPAGTSPGLCPAVRQRGRALGFCLPPPSLIHPRLVENDVTHQSYTNVSCNPR